MSHAAGVGAPLPARGRPGDAAAPGEHARARPQRLPPGLVDRLLDVPRARRPPGRAGAGLRRRVGGPRAARPSRAAARSAAGWVELGGQRVPALVALREVGLEPLVLEAKEGLALLNGTQLMTGDRGAAPRPTPTGSTRTASVAAAMSVEALLGTDVAFAAAYQLARPHPGQIAVAAELRHLLRDSALQASHKGLDPQGPGPVLAALRAAGPRRGARRARPPPARARHRDEQRDRQPARVPRGRRRPTRTRPRPAAGS